MAGLLLAALAVQGVTPGVGKDKLRALVKLPTIAFQQDWTFDPEQGFALGSQAQDVRARISELEDALKSEPDDARSEQELGELYESIGDSQNAGKAWTHAVELYRKQAASDPDDGVLLAGFGWSLENAGRGPEAESLLRQAVRVSSRDSQCWVALGRYLDREARRSVLDPDSEDKPAASEVSLAQKRTDEAGSCFDRAVALAPGEPQVWLRRGLHRCLRKFLSNSIREATDGDDSVRNIFEGCFSTESLADLQHASRLSPDDYQLIGATAMFGVYAGRGRDEQAVSWDALPEKTQVSLRDAMTRLENLAQGADRRTAAGAFEVLGILQGPLLRQPDRCIATMRRAVALEPAREHAWEVLVATLAQGGRYDELLEVCEDQARQTNSARAHLLLAKAHEKLHQWDDCEDEARMAADADPADFSADLSLAAVLLKRSGDV